MLGRAATETLLCCLQRVLRGAHSVCVVTAGVKGLPPPSPREALRFGWVLLGNWFVNNRNLLLTVLEAGSPREDPSVVES